MSLNEETLNGPTSLRHSLVKLVVVGTSCWKIWQSFKVYYVFTCWLLFSCVYSNV